MLSDYEGSPSNPRWACIPVPYAKALDGQEGVTTETLGGIDDPRPQAEGGYDPGVRSCFAVWHKAYPADPHGNMNYLHRGAGARRKGGARRSALFAAAAKAAGRTSTAAPSSRPWPRSRTSRRLSPSSRYGPNKRYGPTEYQVVRLHTNQPPSSQCKMPLDHIPLEGVCWVTVQGWQPLPASG